MNQGSFSVSRLYTIEVSVAHPNASEFRKLAGKTTLWINSIGAKFVPTALLCILSILLVMTMKDAQERRNKLKPKISTHLIQTQSPQGGDSGAQSPSHLQPLIEHRRAYSTSVSATTSDTFMATFNNHNDVQAIALSKPNKNHAVEEIGNLSKNGHNTKRAGEFSLRKCSEVPMKSPSEITEPAKPRGSSLIYVQSNGGTQPLPLSQHTLLPPNGAKFENQNINHIIPQGFLKGSIQKSGHRIRKISKQISSSLSKEERKASDRNQRMNRTTRLLLAVCGMFIVFYLPQVFF